MPSWTRANAEVMSTLQRRARIKASASHLASLSGKRRVNQDQKPTEKSEINKADQTEKNNSQNGEANSALPEANICTKITEDAPKEIESTNDAVDKLLEKQQHDQSSSVVPRPLLKSRFRPNLSESDQQRGRLRRISGCEANPGTPGVRTRTISGSSDDVNLLSPRYN